MCMYDFSGIDVMVTCVRKRNSLYHHKGFKQCAYFSSSRKGLSLLESQCVYQIYQDCAMSDTFRSERR
jgi:hypothetical protein